MQAIGIPKQWTPVVTGDDIVCALLKGRGAVCLAGVASGAIEQLTKLSGA